MNETEELKEELDKLDRRMGKRASWYGEVVIIGTLRKIVAAARRAMVNPDDIRAKGWTVAVHNDYRQDGVRYTFWLFTKDGRAVKGEGITDEEALDNVRKQIAVLENRRSAQSHTNAEIERLRDIPMKECAALRIQGTPYACPILADEVTQTEEGGAIDKLKRSIPDGQASPL